MKAKRHKPIFYVRCIVLLCSLVLCYAENDKNGTTSYDETVSAATDTNRRRFFLFGMFQRSQRSPKEVRIRGRKRKEAKEKTIAVALKMNEKLEEARQLLLSRMAAASFNLIKSEHDAAMNDNTTFFQSDGDPDDITPQSDLSLPNRSIYVVTTAALPWRTGTAVNPLLRAAYLSRRMKIINKGNASIATRSHLFNDTIAESNATQLDTNSTKQFVTLVIPWLELEKDRQELYGPNHTFETSQEQEAHIREWLKNDANMPEEADPEYGLRILFYPARYHSGLKSIFAMGDICAVLRNQTMNESLSDAVCILEEPEHLNWYRAPGEGWTKVFNYVVGIIHTNYIEYASTQFHGLWTAPAIEVMSSAMIRAYCHKVIKLSGVLQTYAPEKEVIENVHGVRKDFIQEGRRRATCSPTDGNTVPLDEQTGGQVYYIGKILWAKGFDLMLDLQKFYHECTGNYFAIDIIGGGPDLEDIKRAFHGRRNVNATKTMKKPTSAKSKKLQPITFSSASLEFEIPKSLYELRKKPIPARFLGPVDHAALGAKYKVFINPSVTEVLCTTTFEALAMGKFAIIPVHESNEFFLRFPNCLGYRNKWEFAASLRWALTHDPEPLTPELANEFTWEAATDRLIQSAAITRKEASERAKLGMDKLDKRIAFFHHELGKGYKGDTIRKVLGGGPIAEQVRYEMIKGYDNGDISHTFKRSSFAQAIKSSFTTGHVQAGFSSTQ